MLENSNDDELKIEIPLLSRDRRASYSLKTLAYNPDPIKLAI